MRHVDMRTIIVCIILKMNNILNIMLFYGLMVYLPFSRRRVFRRSSYHNRLHNIENEQFPALLTRKPCLKTSRLNQTLGNHIRRFDLVVDQRSLYHWSSPVGML